MARPTRLVIPGQPLHVIQRGNDRAATFRDVCDFERYTSVLGEASRRTKCAIHAYVLMTNHVHLLVTSADAHGPTRMMQMVGRQYVRYYNDRHGRTGTLWEGRFRSTLVYSERYFLTCSRYIELNPVRARMVARPEQYRWSSFRHNALGERDELISMHELYSALGTRQAERNAAYRSLFEQALADDDIEAIRLATNRGSVLGPVDFRLEVERMAGYAVSRHAHGGDRRSATYRTVIAVPGQISTTLTP